MTFESSIVSLGSGSTLEEKPTIFVCFSIESDVGKWLEERLFFDLDLVGLCPFFCLRHLIPGKDLNRFQELARTADQIVIICTPGLKDKCMERIYAPIGVAQEVRLAVERYNDPKKANSIFPLYVKGSIRESCPSSFFEPIFGTIITYFENSTDFELFSYYGKMFELFASMRGVSRAEARRIRSKFIDDITKLLSRELSEEDVKEWRALRISRHQIAEKALEERAKQVLGKHPMGKCFIKSQGLLESLQRVALRITEDGYRKREHAFYVEPTCVPSWNRLTEQQFMVSLSEAYQRFINDPTKKVMLLQSYPGFGKTMFTQRIEEELLSSISMENPNARIPLRIELGGLNNPVGAAIEEGLMGQGYSSEQIEELKRLPVVLILDGVDEARFEQKKLTVNQHLYYTNRLYQWENAKVIFGLRVGGASERKVDVNQFRSYRDASNLSIESLGCLTECIICPFSKDQQERYIEQYVRQAPSEWRSHFSEWIKHGGAKYFEMIKIIDQDKGLSETPFTLRILAEFLPAIVRTYP